VAPVPVAPGGIKPNSALATKQMTYANTAGLGGVENHQTSGGETQVGLLLYGVGRSQLRVLVKN
jgi:hypothetical protein